MGDVEHDPAQEQQSIQVVVRPMASSLPLGCFAFGIGNVLLSALTLHWIPVGESTLVALMLLCFVAPLELIPCLLAFFARDAGAATAMGIFAMAWVVQALELLRAPNSPPSAAAGFFLALLGLSLLMLIVASFPGKPLLGGLLSVALLRSLAGASVAFGIHGAMPMVAAGLGLLLACFAFYCALGFLLEDVLGKPLAMTFRRAEARAAMQGDQQLQRKRVFNEAGVRQQL